MLVKGKGNWASAAAAAFRITAETSLELPWLIIILPVADDQRRIIGEADEVL